MKRHSVSLVVFAIFFFSIVGCADKKINVQAPKDVAKSFTIEKQGDDNRSREHSSPIIGIKESSLDKEFLLQGELILQATVANFENLKSRIVAFRKYGRYIYMMEATDGHTVTNDLPQSLVLTKFSIIKKKGDTYLFNFNEGMSKLFLSGDWKAQDFEGSFYKTEWNTVNLGTSFISKAYKNKKNHLIIHQVAQIQSPILGENHQTPVEVRYYLSPYVKNPNFKPTVSKNFERMGFFEISPRLNTEQGGTTIYASKWDTNKPIVFSLSANTPKEYVKAITEGALYWNKSFDKEIIKVIKAPPGVTAPDFFHNIIQWVDWKDAGFAYADAQMDPRTGEILHAQIFLTSVFAISGIEKARTFLRKIEFEKERTSNLPAIVTKDGIKFIDSDSNSKNQSQNNDSLRISLKGFQKNRMCNFRPTHKFADQLTELVATLSELNTHELDSKLLKISQDYIREVVAHEVGHVLGLRHNFAGSLAANYEEKDFDDIYKEYLNQNRAPDGVITSSSVMEYQKFKESTITGDQILTLANALEYDQKAIKNLYFSDKDEIEELPLFCTDSHQDKYVDCNVFDSGKSTLASLKNSEEKMRLRLPYLLMERYIAAKSPPKGYEKVPLGKATMSPFNFAAQVFNNRIKLIRNISSNARFLSVERSFNYLNDLNEWKLELKKKSHVSAQIKNNGGLTRFLASIPVSEILAAKETFLKLLNNDNYTKGKGAGGDYNFTEEELRFIRDEATKFFNALPLAYFLTELVTLKSIKNIIDDESTKNLSNLLKEKVKFYTLTSVGLQKVNIETESEEDAKTELSLPRFLFPHKIRILAGSLLNNANPRISHNLLWGRKARKSIKSDLKFLLDNSINADINKVNIDLLPEAAALWVLQNRLVLASIK